MLHYGAPTPKRSYAFSNSKHVGQLNLGKLIGWAQRKKTLQQDGKARDLVIKYQDGKGKRRWKGSKFLRGSEWGA